MVIIVLVVIYVQRVIIGNLLLCSNFVIFLNNVKNGEGGGEAS